MKRIPAAFQLGGHRFSVKQVSAREMKRLEAQHFPGDPPEPEMLYGMFVPDMLLIYLRKPGKGLTRSVVMQAFWHEYAHAHLWVMGDSRWENEAYVERTGHLLHQATSTFEF